MSKSYDKLIEELNRLTQPKKILYVEDSISQQMVFGELSKKFHCEMDFASSGVDALKKIREIRYNLIIIDMHLPDMSGIDIFQEVFRSEERPPVVFFTVCFNDEEARKAVNMDFVTFIRKPERLNEQFMWKFMETFNIKEKTKENFLDAESAKARTLI